MSGKAGPTSEDSSARHGNAVLESLSTAFSWLTIFPLKGASVFDRTTGSRAMLSVPIVGLVFGLLSLPLFTWLAAWMSNPLLLAILAVVLWQLLSRMMHIDGLADVGDALGSYAEPKRAQEILADRYTGALGMGAVLLTVLVEVAAISSIAGPTQTAIAGMPVRYTEEMPSDFGFPDPSIPAVLIATIPFAARISALVYCSAPFKPFSESGFGALIVGTVRWWQVVVYWLAFSGLTGAILLSATGELSLLTFLPALCLTVLIGYQVTMARKLAKRFGGLNGDCAGFGIQTGHAVYACLLALLMPFTDAVFLY